MFNYRAVGLSIGSELEMPELRAAACAQAAASTPDLQIRLGRVPTDRLLNQQLHPGQFPVGDDYHLVGDDIVFTVPAVASFWARSGSCLMIEPAPNADLRTIRLYTKGSALAAILHQRGLFPLHASAIQGDRGCVLFLGDSGAGKSTLAGMLARRGYKLLSDDVVVATLGPEGRLLAEPSIPVLKLWPASLAVAGIKGCDAPFEAEDHEKHFLTAPESFSSQALPIERLYFLEWHADQSASPSFSALTPFETMLALRTNVYRESLIAAMNREAEFIAFSSTLLAHASSFKLARAADLGQAEQQVDAIERHFASQ